MNRSTKYVQFDCFQFVCSVCTFLWSNVYNLTAQCVLFRWPLCTLKLSSVYSFTVQCLQFDCSVCTVWLFTVYNLFDQCVQLKVKYVYNLSVHCVKFDHCAYVEVPMCKIRLFSLYKLGFICSNSNSKIIEPNN